MQAYTLNKKIYVTNAIIFILAIWFLLSLCNDPLVIPPIGLIIAKLAEILIQVGTLTDVLITLGRLLLAMLISIGIGVGLGAFAGALFPSVVKNTLKEVLKIFQIIPPVAVLIMGIMSFGLNGIPAIFIVAISLIPLIAIQVIDAIDNIDTKLVEMGRVFKLSQKEMLFRVYIPSIEPALWSSIIVSLTMGGKMIVMGEVLTTETGIGEG